MRLSDQTTYLCFNTKRENSIFVRNLIKKRQKRIILPEYYFHMHDRYIITSNIQTLNDVRHKNTSDIK